MERPDESGSLRRRARLAYEVGRLGRAIARAWPVPIAAFLAYRLGTPGAQVAALALLLAIAAIALTWRGRVPGRAVEPGLLAGAAPLVLPGLAMDGATACSASCATWCATSCVVGGVFAGGVVGFLAWRLHGGGWLFGVTAAAIAAVTGAMGCCLAGASGVTGMLLGIAAAAVPILVVATRSR